MFGLARVTYQHCLAPSLRIESFMLHMSTSVLGLDIVLTEPADLNIQVLERDTSFT